MVDAAADLDVRTITVTRYVSPLREGGSLPAIVEGDDLGTYVLKFRGAGQGPRVLIAELIAGRLAQALDLPMPEIVFAELDPVLARAEPDPEIQDLLTASAGLNLALDFLPGSFTFDPVVAPPVDPLLASRIVWFDALITNVDRTIRNTNLLLWHRQLYLIDNGAAFYAQYSGPDFPRRARNPFPAIQSHVLIEQARALEEADRRSSAILTPDIIRRVVAPVPDSWLEAGDFPEAEAHREAFVRYLSDRLKPPRLFLQEALDAHAQSV